MIHPSRGRQSERSTRELEFNYVSSLQRKSVTPPSRQFPRTDSCAMLFLAAVRAPQLSRVTCSFAGHRPEIRTATLLLASSECRRVEYYALAGPSAATSNNVVPCNDTTSRSFWFQSSDLDNRIPVRPEGDLLDRSTSKRRATASSGRTGSSHFIESIPGEPKDSDSNKTLRTISSIAIEHVCHPLAMSPLHLP